MAKINFSFNGSNYSVDESSLATAIASLKSHLSTKMNGTGATITLGGVAYSIDAAKLSAEENKFAAYLNTIGGSTPDVPTEERLEGDGAEYYTLAPTALSFRSTAPLNELQEVQINGVTVDPSNYTLEEGSTIVTFPIEYLKTLEKGNYEVNIVSDSKTVSGGFTVAAPELNEHGFYYNQPYTAYVPMLGGKKAFFLREDSTLDVIDVTSGGIETGTFTCNGKNASMIVSIGTLTGTWSDDGKSIYCNELQVTASLGDESIVSDEDYIYIYKEELGAYEVRAIDKTKIEYGAIKTGINGIDTTRLGDSAFSNNRNITRVIIPSSLISIGDVAFAECDSLNSIIFDGTVAQWNAITKGYDWNRSVPATYVQCSDGTVAL